MNEQTKMDNLETKTETLAVAEVETATTEKVSANISPVEVNPNSRKKMLIGKVTSNKADKTIIVSVERQVIHPLYRKYFKRTKRFMAHDETNTCKLGDKVKISECRPLSANKRWILVDIIQRAK